MRYILYVGLDGFYARRFESDLAVVVHWLGRVVDSCERARSRRVWPGMALSEAKAILREGARYIEFKEADFRAARDAWLDLCLLYSGRIEHESPASAWIDLSLHPRPLEIAGSLLADLWRFEALDFRAAIAPAKWIAKVAARRCDRSLLGLTDVLLVEEPASFLASLPTRSLAPVAEEHRRRLEFLGYWTIGEVQKAPLQLLNAQFGKDGIVIRQSALGLIDDPVVPNYPRLSLECVRAFEGCCSDQTVLEAAIDEIADDLGARLSRTDMLAGETDLFVSLEAGQVLQHVRKLPRPTNALTLGLRFQLSQVRMVAPVAAMRVTVPDLRPVSTVQRALDPSGRLDRERSATTAVQKLGSVYGPNTVQQASKIALPRRNQLLKAWKEANGWR